MAIADAYATVAAFQAITQHTVTTDGKLIEDDLVAVSRYMEGVLGCFFNKDAAPVARIFWGDGQRRLRVSDPSVGGAPIADPAGLSIKFDLLLNGTFADDSALATTDYQLWPLNADKGPEPKPWTHLYLPLWSPWGGFPAGIPVEVTAVWGWPAVPKAIQRACIDLTSILRMESPRATRQVNTSLNEVLSTSSAAVEILDGLMEIYTMPVVV